MRSDGDNKASFKKVILRNAKVTGEIVMDGASFAGDLDADSLYVGGSLLMRSDAKNKASALTQTEDTGTFASLLKMALAEVVQTKGLDALLWAAM